MKCTRFPSSIAFWTRLSVGAVVVAIATACAGGDRPPSTGDSAAPQTAANTPATPAAGSGAQIYQRCVTCHQANGEGVPGAFPPLAGSEFATAANPSVPIRVVLHGMQGPVTVKGQQFNGLMPQYGTGITMSDEEVAAVLTYVRSSFGNSASAITADMVAKERAAERAASGPVTAEELHALMQ